MQRENLVLSMRHAFGGPLVTVLTYLGAWPGATQTRADDSVTQTGSADTKTATILVGNPFPRGSERKLTASEHLTFRRLISSAKEKTFGQGSPPAVLCAIKMDGRSYFFLRTGEPVNFSLSPEKLLEFKAFVPQLLGRSKSP